MTAIPACGVRWPAAYMRKPDQSTRTAWPLVVAWQGSAASRSSMVIAPRTRHGLRSRVAHSLAASRLVSHVCCLSAWLGANCSVVCSGSWSGLSGPQPAGPHCPCCCCRCCRHCSPSSTTGLRLVYGWSMTGLRPVADPVETKC